MRDRPTARELLEAVAEFLARDVRPKLDPVGAFHARVAENILALLVREWEEGAKADAAEHERLRHLLGRDGSLAELNRALAKAVRARSLGDREAALLAHLRASTEAKLAIDNPRYAEKP